MTDLRALFLENPELRRNLRIELSPKRVLTAGIITAVYALIVLPSLLNGKGPGISRGGPGLASSYLMVLLWSQRITLTLGGAIFCWRAVRRERELNTYDYQRITRLSPLELAVGKLFGAPALAYFVTLCLVLPAVLSAATTSGTTIAMLLRSYVLLFTGSLLVHSFALMVSTVSDKGGASNGVLLLILLQILPAIVWFTGAKTSPQYAGQAADVRFYGITFPVIFLWVCLELGFTVWFLLAVVRNIKIDPESMQLYTVGQGVAFAAYCNFVWIGFYPWRPGSSGSASPLLFLAVVFFYLIGIGVLRSRELVRRKLREATKAFSENRWLLAPIGAVALGAVLTQVVIVTLAWPHSYSAPGARATHDFLLVFYLAAWVARDLFYLQWMKIRPVRSALGKAILYLVVFYVATSIVFRSSLTSTHADAALAGCLVPFPLLRRWTELRLENASGMWPLALVAQLAAAAGFAYLYRQQVAGLGRRPQAAPLARVS